MVRMDTVITRLDAADFRDRLPEALGVYVEAMGYPPQVIRTRWRRSDRRRTIFRSGGCSSKNF